jgi:hypothetical protein
MTGSEMQREKEKVAAKMREKQAAGWFWGRQRVLQNKLTDSSGCEEGC